MKRNLFLVIIILMAAVRGFALESVAVTEFMNESKGDETTGEWVELFNFGATDVNLSGWFLADQDSDTIQLSAFVLKPGHFVVIARDKSYFESEWFGGLAQPDVVQEGPGTFAMSSSTDEIILKNASSQVVWSLAYKDDDTVGRATYLTGTDFTHRVSGSKSLPGVNRNGFDSVGFLGYEKNDATTDTLEFFSGEGDVGSPLQGNYPGAVSTANLNLTVDAASPGEAISPMVRGLAIADNTIDRTTYQIGIPDCLRLSNGSTLRGVAAGLYADLYDWRVRNNEPRPTTLEFQRYARDHDDTLIVTANTRGLVEPDPNDPGRLNYYTTDTTVLANLAADWVHYTNKIVQQYRQGDTVSDPRDNSILGQLVWSSAYPGDTFDKLLTPGEQPVAPVSYWEIGNEPTVSVANSIGVNNGSALSPEDYYARYKAIAQAMKAEDPQIHVGPCLVNGKTNSGGTHLGLILADQTAPIDFISYHPYQKMGDLDDPDDITGYLGGVFQNQSEAVSIIRDDISASGRNPDDIKLVASEVNVSDWPYNDTVKEGQMAHALGSVETVFTHARLGLLAAHYWIWIAHAGDGTSYPLTLAWEKLRDFMGNRLLNVATYDNSVRFYATHDTGTRRTALWILNFSNTNDSQVTVTLNGFPDGATLTQYRLQQLVGKTTLFSANLSGQQPGGPITQVGWVQSDRSAEPLQNLEIAAPAATLTVLVAAPKDPPSGVGETAFKY